MSQENAGGKKSRAQVAFEFMVVYSFIVVIFIVIFLLITSERSAAANSQAYSSLQLVAQSIASYINAAVYAGNGYNASIPLVTSIGSAPFNVTISSTGVVIVSSKLGSQITSAYAYSNARNVFVNGTNSIQSTNAIQLTVLKNTGTIKIYDISGRIFINRNPFNVSALMPISLSTKIVAKGPAAFFNGVNSFAVENGIPLVNQLPKFSITAWIDPVNTSSSNQIIFSEATYTRGLLSFGPDEVGNIKICDYNVNTNPNVNCVGADTLHSQRSNWTFVVLTFNGIGGGAGTLNISLNNGPVWQDTSWESENDPTATLSYLVIGASATNVLGAVGAGQTGLPFNGFITDVQVYNTTLSPNAITALYNEGFIGAPIKTANIIAWYMLSGSTLDYSGRNNQAYANNITYQTVAQVDASGISSYGTVTSPMSVFTISNGIFGAGGRFYSNYSSSGGVPSSVFIESNGTEGQINFTASEFNGQNGLALGSSLAAWFPLDAGYGTSVGGFSSVGGMNTASNPIILNEVGSYNGFPKWSAIGQNVTNFMVGNFPGYGNVGYLSYPYINAYNNIVSNNTFTIVAWMYTVGQPHDQGILSDVSTIKTPGFDFFLDDTSNAPRLYADSAYFGGALPTIVGNWIMVTAEYNGNAGLVNFYYNNTLVLQQKTSTSISLQSTNPMKIGDEGFDSTGADTFRGILANVQLYSTFLNQSQVQYIWKQGTTGIPISAPGLVGWWPLNGNPNDSSAFHNTGTVNGNVNFINSQFSNYSLGGTPRYALTFGHQARTGFYTKYADIMSGNEVTVVAWINPKQFPSLSSDSYNDIFFSYGPMLCADEGQSLSLGINYGGHPIASAWCDDFTPAKGPSVNWNSWNFVAYTVNEVNVSIFLNGVWENGTLSGGVPLNLQPGQLDIGAEEKTSQRAFNGSITDLQVYNGILTTEQIWALYNEGMAPSARLNLSVS